VAPVQTRTYDNLISPCLISDADIDAGGREQINQILFPATIKKTIKQKG
jgi:hypothetical protein